MALHRLDERRADRARRGAFDELGRDAEARVVVEAADELELVAALELHAAHDVHLPELHGAHPLPAPVVLAALATALRIDQAMAHEAAVDRGARGQRSDLLTAEVVSDGARAPAGVGAAQFDDARLDLRRHLVRAGGRPRGVVGESGDAAARIAAQPAVHGLPAHPVAARHLGDAGAAQDLEHCLMTLLHDSQLDEHDLCPPSNRLSYESLSRELRRRRRAWSVTQVPEPLSPGYRSRVPKLSRTYRSHSVKHVPGPYMLVPLPRVGR